MRDEYVAAVNLRENGVYISSAGDIYYITAENVPMIGWRLNPVITPAHIIRGMYFKHYKDPISFKVPPTYK